MESVWKRFWGFLVKRLGTVGGVIAWGAAFIAVAFLSRIVDWATRGWIDRTLVEPAWSAFLRAANAPVGAVLLVLLLAFLLFNCLTFGLAWFDTTQTAAKLRGSRPKLGLEERAAVDEVRRMWRAEPHAACARAIAALDAGVRVLQQHGNYWASLLWGPRNALHTTSKQLHDGLETSGKLPLGEVLNLYNAVVDAYSTCAVWHYRLRCHLPDLFTNKDGAFSRRDFDNWQILHEPFARRHNDIRRGEYFVGRGLGFLETDLREFRTHDDPPPDRQLALQAGAE